MKPKSAFWRKARLGMIGLCLLFSFHQAIAPAPAYAQGTPIFDVRQLATNIMDLASRIARWVMEEVQYNSMIASLTEQYTQMVDKLSQHTGEVYRTGAIQSAAQRLETEQRIREAQAIMDTRTNNTIAAANARVTAKYTPPRNAQLCRTIMIHQLATTSEEFARELSRAIADGVSNRYRMPGSDGMGPATTRRIFEQACNGPVRTGSPLDGIPCFENNLVATDGDTSHDGDKSMPKRTQIYEMPRIRTVSYTNPITNQTTTVRVPADPSTDEQRFFSMKLDWLFHVAGRRPTPASGRDMFTVTGMAQRAMFNHCAANQNALVKQCADWLAFLTRPNREDPEAQTLRNEQNRLCLSMRNYIDIAKFGNCEQGLSAYETHLIQQAWCQNKNYYLGLKNSGASDSEAFDSIDVCTRSWHHFDKFVSAKENACVQAQAVLESDGMRDCWAAVGSMGKGGE